MAEPSLTDPTNPDAAEILERPPEGSPRNDEMVRFMGVPSVMSPGPTVAFMHPERVIYSLGALHTAIKVLLSAPDPESHTDAALMLAELGEHVADQLTNRL